MKINLALVLAPLIILAMVLVIRVIRNPGLTSSAGGRLLAFFAIFLLPLVLLGQVTNLELEQAKTTEFCLSCHVMKPYGKSLRIDEPGHIPAEHFQNKRVPRDQACYTCHTTYALFGDTKAKMSGLLHLWVNYFGTIPDPIELYQPFANRECLHCHRGARSFEENEMHVDIRGELHANELSCLDCHDSTHDLDHLDAHPMWDPEATP